ncbi:hypothetical protein R1flu_017741 [Riccia fluitans]|uniref:Uncharacterized protein n=1 Tax=Riccia fluitans TaxID=41844 RepID=A0ABD1ZDU2_9MARC
MSHSPNLDKLDQEASMQNIDRLVEALEMEARESSASKRRKLFSDEASNSALQVYQPPDREEPSTSALQVYQPPDREEPWLQPFRFINPLSIRLCRLSQILGSHSNNVLSRDEVSPYVNTQRLKTDGILKISCDLFQLTRSNTGTTFEWIMDLFATSLRKLVDFPDKEECRRIVPPSEVEAQFLKLTGHKYKKDAWQDIAPWFGFSLAHSQPRSKGCVVDDFKKFSLEGHPDGYALDKLVCLVIKQVQKMVDWHMWVSFEIYGHMGHDRNDKFSGGKFREGWHAIMRIVLADFLAKQATMRHEPLLLEARNAFTNTRAKWDSEKGELVREREALNSVRTLCDRGLFVTMKEDSS